MASHQKRKHFLESCRDDVFISFGEESGRAPGPDHRSHCLSSQQRPILLTVFTSCVPYPSRDHGRVQGFQVF